MYTSTTETQLKSYEASPAQTQCYLPPTILDLTQARKSLYQFTQSVEKKLSWPGWVVGYQEKLPAGKQSPSQVVTMPSVKQLCWLNRIC